MVNGRVLDPRTKLFISLAATGALMFFHHWTPLAVALAILLGVTLGLQLQRAWLTLLKGLGFAAASFFLIAWYAFDLPTALEAGFRLLALGTVFFLLFQTTAPEDLSNALVKWGLPYAFAFVVSVSMQYIPVLARRASNIRDAQESRGIPLRGGLKALRHLPALLGPLLIQAFKLADEMAEAMEARGFGAPGRRFRREPRFRWVDWIVIGLSVAMIVGLVWGLLL